MITVNFTDSNPLGKTKKCIQGIMQRRSEWAPNVSVYLFYISFFMYVGASVLRDTTIQYDHKTISALLQQCFWVPVILAAVNVLLFTDYTWGQRISYAAFAVVFWISYKNYGNYRLFHSFVILLSARFVAWKPFLKRILLLYSLLLAAVFAGDVVGLLSPVDIYVRGDAVRWTLGFVHPNLLGGYLMVIAMIWVALRYETFQIADAIGLLALFVFTWVGPASRTSALVIALLLVSTALTKRCGTWLLSCRLTRFLTIYIYPVCFLFTFFCAYFYSDDSAFFVTLDSVLSGRVRFGHLFLKKYLHTWFGQKVKQVDNRTALLKGKETMYLDSSYLRLYIGVGIVGCLITLWIFTRIMRYAVENARWDIILIAAVMAFYGISELYITYMHWSFYLICFAALPEFRLSDYKIGQKGWFGRLVLVTGAPEEDKCSQ